MGKTTGTMNKIAAWGDLKVAGILRDFKKEEPVQDPAPSRALFRVLFFITLIAGFSLSLAYLFWEAPDVRIKQISNVQGKNHNYPIGKLYNKTNGQAYDPISCPCTVTSISIANILNFYVLYEDSPEWSIGYNANVQPLSINVPDFNTSANQLAGHVQPDPVPLTADTFCNSTYLWPVNDTVVAEFSDSQRKYMCGFAELVIPNPNSNSPGSSVPLETPDLLNGEALAASIFQLVQANLVALQSLFATDVANPTATTYGNALVASLLTVPMIYGVGSDPWEVYYDGAISQASRLDTLQYFNSSNPTVLVLNTSKGIGFLQMSADWMTYYKMCNPKYCQETMQMGYLRKLYWAVGLLGGTVTVVLGVVNIVLWPFTVFVLSWLYTKHDSFPNSHAKSDLHDPDVGPSGSKIGPLTQEPCFLEDDEHI